MDQSSEPNQLPQTLEGCEKLLALDDFIFEPIVNQVISNYRQVGGSDERVKELLTNGYRGLSSLANLFGYLLSILESDELPSTSKKAQPLDFDSTEMSETVRSTFETIASSMISKVFNADSADKIFEGDSDIDWLPELITHRPWRKLIYELSEQNPQCLMLNFAVKLVSDAGFQHEISSVSTAAQQLDIFSRVFLSSVDQLLRAFNYGENTKIFDNAFAELIRVACHSEHTYLYAQSILRVMTVKNTGKFSAACSFISQILRLSKNNRRLETSILQIGLLQSEKDTIPPNTIHAILTMISKQSLNPADVNQLYQAFIDPNPPPVELIRDPLFIDILINSLFNATAPKMNLDYKPKYIYLLAYASCVGETVKSGSRVQTKAELDGTRERITNLLNILHSSDDPLHHLAQIIQYAKTPVLARGTLHFVKSTILREDFLAEPQLSHLILIDQIVNLHPNLRPSVFTILCQLYEYQSTRNELAEVVMSRQRVVIDRFVHMLSTGYALPVLEVVAKMYEEARIDVSLVRYFGVEVLEVAGEPFSQEFVDRFLPIVLKTEVFDRNTLEKHKQVAVFIDQMACRK
ncbi:Negative elongation factor D [Aphelenchoides besseyi]|nr:Negative elongation factor D [Aphelenchoides besseyi]